jgi:hypothetical protein
MSKLDDWFIKWCEQAAMYWTPELEIEAKQQVKDLMLQQLDKAQSNLRCKYQLNRSQRHGMDILAEEVRQNVSEL